ncbi:MAG: hypothetical protein QOI13_816, partial [Paraburkholderia sp.]|nr:hypothetical protein [Paraburkholderia sp.]
PRPTAAARWSGSNTAGRLGGRNLGRGGRDADRGGRGRGSLRCHRLQHMFGGSSGAWLGCYRYCGGPIRHLASRRLRNALRPQKRDFDRRFFGGRRDWCALVREPGPNDAMQDQHRRQDCAPAPYARGGRPGGGRGAGDNGGGGRSRSKGRRHGDNREQLEGGKRAMLLTIPELARMVRRRG